MYVYIAHRNLMHYFSQNAACGGVPTNNDYRFTLANKGPNYLITLNNANYAVYKAEGDKFIEEVLSKCTEEHPGFFPMVTSLNGKETAAVVEIEREVDRGGHTRTQVFYCDMDDEVLLQMLEDLRAKSGEPLDERALMNYCYPNPVLPEGDFDLNYIYHQIYCKEEPVPQGAIRTMSPDKRVSCFGTSTKGIYVEIREDNIKKTYKVPAGLLPEIKEKVRELCREPAEAYVEHGDPEGFIKFDKDKKRIFTDPDKTLALLKEIASKSEFDYSEEVDMRKYYPVRKRPAGYVPGIGMMGLSAFTGGPFGNGMVLNQMSAAPAAPAAPVQSPASSDSNKCVYCGADVTGKKFCIECGGEVKK